MKQNSNPWPLRQALHNRPPEPWHHANTSLCGLGCPQESMKCQRNETTFCFKVLDENDARRVLGRMSSVNGQRVQHFR